MQLFQFKKINKSLILLRRVLRILPHQQDDAQTCVCVSGERMFTPDRTSPCACVKPHRQLMAQFLPKTSCEPRRFHIFTFWLVPLLPSPRLPFPPAPASLSPSLSPSFSVGSCCCCFHRGSRRVMPSATEDSPGDQSRRWFRGFSWRNHFGCSTPQAPPPSHVGMAAPGESSPEPGPPFLKTQSSSIDFDLEDRVQEETTDEEDWRDPVCSLEAIYENEPTKNPTISKHVHIMEDPIGQLTPEDNQEEAIGMQSYDIPCVPEMTPSVPEMTPSVPEMNLEADSDTIPPEIRVIWIRKPEDDIAYGAGDTEEET